MLLLAGNKDIGFTKYYRTKHLNILLLFLINIIQLWVYTFLVKTLLNPLN